MFVLVSLSTDNTTDLCLQAAHTLHRFCMVGPESLWCRRISAETLYFCSEHSEGLLSTWPGQVRPHPPDTFLSPEPTPGRHRAG